MTDAQLMKAQPFIIIIRAIHERGPNQDQALSALKARGLWLTDEQKQQAGLSP